MIFGHRLRTALDNLKPDVKGTLRYTHIKSEIENSGHRFRQFKDGDNVYTRTNIEKQWTPGKIAYLTNKYSYKVITPDGVEKTRRSHS